MTHISFFKKPRLANKKYTDWVKTQPSCISQKPADDPHHIKGHGYTGGVTPDDYMTMPLTRDEHTHLHNIGYEAWEKIYGDQRGHVLDTLMNAIRQGVLEVKL